MSGASESEERLRRWRLALGAASEAGMSLSGTDQRLDAALSAVYESADQPKSAGSLKGSSPRVARWLGDIRDFFPSSLVQVIQRDAFERLGLKQMLLEPEFLGALEADVHLVADLVALRAVMPEKTKSTARIVIDKVVRQLMERLQLKTIEAVKGALDRSVRTARPRPRDIDWPRTIRLNLATYQPDLKTIIPQRLTGLARRSRIQGLEQVVLCVDQSGSMASSVVYSSIFAAVLASIPALRTKLVVFDTSVLDLSADLADPVDVLFGVQLGGGTNIAQALGYCEALIEEPARTHLILISDLYEGGDSQQFIARAAGLVGRGVNLIALLALSDTGKPASCEPNARALAALGIPVFACTPDLFPELMAAALQRSDIAAWAASRDIALARA